MCLGAFYAQQVASPVDPYAAAMAAYNLYNTGAAGIGSTMGASSANTPLSNMACGSGSVPLVNRQLGPMSGNGSGSRGNLGQVRERNLLRRSGSKHGVEFLNSFLSISPHVRVIRSLLPINLAHGLRVGYALLSLFVLHIDALCRALVRLQTA